MAFPKGLLAAFSGRRLYWAIRYLGGERERLWSEADALLLVTRKAWQLEDDFSGDILVLETPDLVVAADASLFDKKGLARKLSTA